MDMEKSELEIFYDKRFPAIDVALRKGFHFTEDDLDSWHFLVKNKQILSDFYSRYQAELLYDTEGFIYLSAFDSLFKQQKLRPSDMIVGQVLALYLVDPTILRNGGKVRKEDVISRISHLIPSEQIPYLFYAARTRKARTDLDDIKLKEAIEKSIRLLESLGFLSLDREELIRPHSSIYRFAALAKVKDGRDSVLKQLTSKGLATSESVDPDFMKYDGDDESSSDFLSLKNRQGSSDDRGEENSDGQFEIKNDDQSDRADRHESI
jgi:chromosome condensin MukBEF MukE localization factor